MDIHLGLGTNLGDRRSNLRAAIQEIEREGIKIKNVSPVVESPALLPVGADPAWNKPFLNLVVCADTTLGPRECLTRIKQIEAALGRTPGARWAPRVIDIDILLYGESVVAEDDLHIPHPGLATRAFVVTPLVALAPGLQVTGHEPGSVFELSQSLDHQIPLWMGIVNLTPDSFSDGGRWTDPDAAVRHAIEMAEAGAHYIDLGAESTRPGASPISADEEWSRLAPVLEQLTDHFRDDRLRPRISIDTYHAAVAERAFAIGADMINDVTGLTSDAMIELAAGSDGQWVAMHQISIPADPRQTLPRDVDAPEAVERWIETQIERWGRRGLGLDRIYVDPGIGFGKNPLQSLELLRHCGRFRRHGLRTLIGHSRKSFMGSFSGTDNTMRDLTTVGASLEVIEQGADIIRVHNVEAHVTAYLGWAHLRAPEPSAAL